MPEAGRRRATDIDSSQRSCFLEYKFKGVCGMFASGSGTLVHPVSFLFNKLRLNVGLKESCEGRDKQHSGPFLKVPTEGMGCGRETDSDSI